MSLTRIQKETIVKSVTDKLSKSNVLLFTSFAKISVEKLKRLRKDLKAKGVDFQVVKKNLLRVALEKANIDASEAGMKGIPEACGVVFGTDDQISPVRAVFTFAKAKENASFKIIGGMLDHGFVTPDRMAPLAKVSTKEDLYARLLGQLQAPLSKLVYVIKAVGESKTTGQ
ncbi:MAG: 50S ribosomal protein L10 [Candidatus Azambacteria bacterium]|nr:50S ribosomal protein L10 [Candidatus Azambacteria bacterium]